MKSLFLSIALLVSVNCIAQTITVEEASKYIGKKVTVCGKVYGSEFSKTGFTFLYMGAAYPDHPFTAAIFEGEIDKFSATPESLYKDKEICVTGKIKEYQGKPQIVINKDSQIKVVK